MHRRDKIGDSVYWLLILLAALIAVWIVITEWIRQVELLVDAEPAATLADSHGPRLLSLLGSTSLAPNRIRV